MIRKLALFALAMTATPVFAGDLAEWGKYGHWTVYGNSKEQRCLATTVYTNGRSLGIVFDKENGGTLVISHAGVKAGEQYSVRVASSLGETGTLTGVGTPSDMVVFNGVNEATLRNLMKARSFFVEGIGELELTGSAKAMTATLECYQALNSY